MEVNVTKRKGDPETDHGTEAKKARESDGEVRTYVSIPFIGRNTLSVKNSRFK